MNAGVGQKHMRVARGAVGLFGSRERIYERAPKDPTDPSRGVAHE